jgi:hypothetical protein
MPELPPKSSLNIAIDFFFGALGGDVVVAIGFLRAMRQNYYIDSAWATFAVLILSATLIGGSLAALYRNQFWSSLETYSILPPMEERLSTKSKMVLWSLFGLGCASLGLLAIR